MASPKAGFAGENRMVRSGSTRITGRDGVNTARYFFEHHGCTFQEVGQQHDFGKDAYVDLADDAGITPLCVALQIKAGISYRTAQGDYAVPWTVMRNCGGGPQSRSSASCTIPAMICSAGWI